MAFQINTVTVSGNLTSDPEVRHTPSQMAITRLSIAHNERRKNSQTGDFEDVAHFFDITVFGRIGEVLAGDLRKGDPVVVSGNLEQRRWQDQQGNNRSAVSIVARDIVRGQRGGGGGGGGQGGGYQQGGGYDQGASYGAPQGGGGYGGGQGGGGGGYDRGGAPGGGGYGSPQPAAAPAPQGGGGYSRQGSDVAVDTSDFAPAPQRGGSLPDPGEDDIPF